MKKTPIRVFAEKILFELNRPDTLIGDYAYSKRKAVLASGRYWLCGHWVDKQTEKRFYTKKRTYYRYHIPKQWE